MAETNGNGKSWEFLRWAATLALAALVSYYTTTGTINTRLAVAEARITQLGEDIRDIKYDIKEILRAVR